MLQGLASPLYASWIDNTAYASEPWMGFQLFRTLADWEYYDASMANWGVQNIVENVALGGVIGATAQTASTGSSTAGSLF